MNNIPNRDEVSKKTIKIFQKSRQHGKTLNMANGLKKKGDMKNHQLVTHEIKT